MVAARQGRTLFGVDFDQVIRSVDWNRVAIESMGRHLRKHPDSDAPICGPCIMATALAHADEPLYDGASGSFELGHPHALSGSTPEDGEQE